jgi:putative membrane protein
MLPASIAENDKKAFRLIAGFSIIVFLAISFLSRVHLDVNLGFDKHLFAKANAFINTMVALLLLAALYFVKAKNYRLHKQMMLTAMVLSVLFLVSYICHHLFTGDTKYGDLDHNGLLSDAEKTAAGGIRYFYYFIISTHILLAGIVMPFVLYTAYRGLTAQFNKHRKLARITWPIWFYVAVTGPIVYWMIKPYYG